MPESLDTIRRQVRDRMKELAPLVDEYRQLEEASAALEGRAAAERTGAGAAPARRRGSRGPGAGTGRRGRPKGSGTRAQQALELVRARPGITIPELADAMGIKQNYLYRVMPTLADEGLVSKAGRGWHARNGSGAIDDGALAEAAEEASVA
jgi:hypothetical protein